MPIRITLERLNLKCYLILELLNALHVHVILIIGLQEKYAYRRF